MSGAQERSCNEETDERTVPKASERWCRGNRSRLRTSTTEWADLELSLA